MAMRMETEQFSSPLLSVGKDTAGGFDWSSGRDHEDDAERQEEPLSFGPNDGYEPTNADAGPPPRSPSLNSVRSFIRRAKSSLTLTSSPNPSTSSFPTQLAPASPSLAEPPRTSPNIPLAPIPSLKGKERDCSYSNPTSPTLDPPGQPWIATSSTMSKESVLSTEGDVEKRRPSLLSRRSNFFSFSKKNGVSIRKDPDKPDGTDATDGTYTPPLPDVESTPASLPSLPSLQFSSHRLSWGFNSTSSPAPSILSQSINRSGDSPARRLRPERNTDLNDETHPVCESPEEELLNRGLGLAMPSPPVQRRVSTLARFRRSNSTSSIIAPKLPTIAARPRSASNTPLSPSSSMSALAQAALPIPSLAVPSSSSPPQYSPPVTRPPSATPSDSFPRSNANRRPRTTGSTTPTGVLGSVAGFFSNSMARSRSSSSASLAPPPPLTDVTDFAALFEGKGRTRGMSAISTVGSRGASTTSLSGGFKDAALLVPINGTPLVASGSTTTTQSRSSTRRFSLSSNSMSSTQSGHPNGASSPTTVERSLPRSSLSEETSDLEKSRKRSLTIREKETPSTYVHRLMASVSPGEVVGFLARVADSFHADAMRIYFDTFHFKSLPLDIALRMFLLSAALPPETQQIDRVMEAFALRYHSENPGLFDSSDTPYVLAFSLILLNSDQFNKNNKVKMTREAYVKNTKVDGVEREILEYFYDQITLAPFIFVHDADVEQTDTPAKRPELAHSTSSFFGSTKERKVDPYAMIAAGLTSDFRLDVEAVIPTRSPFSFTGTTSTFFNAAALHQVFARAPILQIISTRGRAELPPDSSFVEGAAMASLKIVKIGVLSRKEDFVQGKKSASRKWKSWSVILTGSQLLFFKDPSWTLSLAQSIAKSADSNQEERQVITLPPSSSFKPDAVLSLADCAAIYDSTYDRYQNVFRLVGTAGKDYLFQAKNASDLNSWLAHLNFGASFKTAGLKIPSLSPSHQHTTTRLAPPPNRPRATSVPDHLREALDLAYPRVGGDSDFAGDEEPEEEGEVSSRVVATRSESLKRAIATFEQQILAAKATLQPSLRSSRHLAILTPFMRPTRERIQLAIGPLEKRIRHARMDIVKLVCFREVLVRDLMRESGLKSRTSRRSIRSNKRRSLTEAESDVEKEESDPFESAREDVKSPFGDLEGSSPVSDEY